MSIKDLFSKGKSFKTLRPVLVRKAPPSNLKDILGPSLRTYNDSFQKLISRLRQTLLSMAQQRGIIPILFLESMTNIRMMAPYRKSKSLKTHHHI